jgi:monoamine oxidase
MDAALSTSNADAARVDADRPWASPDARPWDARTVAEWIENLSVSPLCKRGLHAQLTADNGVDTAWQSYLGNLAQIKGGGVEKYWTESEVFRCKGGNQQLATKLAATIPPDRLLLRTPVRAVTMSDRGGIVTLADGKQLEADEIVLAVPPSVWNKVAIDPALPPHIQPQIGANVKFLMAFRSAFWRGAELAPDLLSDGPVQMTWETTSGQPGRSAALVAFSGGSAADVTREWGAQRTATYLKTLSTVYKGIGASFIRGRYMDWPADVWVKGSYTFPAPGQITAIGSTLHDGIGHLHFAGEHMNYAFIGYMEGALGSGVAVARRIAASDGLLKVA